MSRIDPRAVVSPKAELADDVEVGPFAVIGADVTLGPGCDRGLGACGIGVLLPQSRSTHGRNSISQVQAERGWRRTLR